MTTEKLEEMTIENDRYISGDKEWKKAIDNTLQSILDQIKETNQKIEKMMTKDYTTQNSLQAVDSEIKAISAQVNELNQFLPYLRSIKWVIGGLATAALGGLVAIVTAVYQLIIRT